MEIRLVQRWVLVLALAGATAACGGGGDDAATEGGTDAATEGGDDAATEGGTDGGGDPVVPDAGPASEAYPPGDHEVRLAHGDRDDRFFLLHVPPAAEAEPRRELPLVLKLHAGMSGPEDAYSFTEQADRDGVIVARPAGTSAAAEQQRSGLHWNDLRDTDQLAPHANGIDDVGFIEAVIDTIDAELDVDRDRVYVTGLSNGGSMAMAFACQRGALLAGMATHISQIAATLASCEPGGEGRFGVLMVNGRDDPIVPFEGGEPFGNRGEIASAPGTLELFRSYHGCGEPEMSSSDEIDVYSAPGCQGDVHVALEIHPMGHGPISDELHDRAWDFLLGQ